MKKNLNIALFSPSKNPYSETFIQAHKDLLPGKVSYYYGYSSNIQIEGDHMPKAKYSIFRKIVKKIFKKSSFFSVWKPLLSSLREREINVILIEYGTHAYSLLPFLKLVKIPFVVHFHGYDAFSLKAIENCKKYVSIFESASAVIAVSLEMQNQLLMLGCPSEKVYYNPNAPQKKFLKEKAMFTKKQLISVGRFTDKKAPYFTILAFSKIAHKFKDAKLVMVGNGVLYNTCNNLVKYLNLQDQVFFLGVKTSDEIVMLMKESRALIQHSITANSGDKEGMPIAVLEAGAIGLPVIATRHSGIVDVVVEQETGLLCNEGDVDTMSNHMYRLLDQKGEAISLGNSAKQRILSEFSMDKHINGLYNILDIAVGE